MELDYLNYDDSYSLAVKCIWALGAIGTDNSRDRLKKLASSGRKIVEEAAAQKGAFDYSRTNPKYIYNALDDAAHKGYQTWHRQYDATVVKWLQNNPAATTAQFDKYLHNLHQQPWLKSRIPNVNLLR